MHVCVLCQCMYALCVYAACQSHKRGVAHGSEGGYLHKGLEVLQFASLVEILPQPEIRGEIT